MILTILFSFILSVSIDAKTCSPSQVVPNEYIVKLKTAGVIPQRLSKDKFKIERFKTSSKFVKIKTQVAISEFASFGLDKSNIEYIEPNFIVHAYDLPSDSQFSNLWNLLNTGQVVGGDGRPHADINIVPLWAKGFTGAQKIKVAITDTGIDWNHPDLIDNLYTNPGEAGSLAFNGIDDDQNGFIDDVHGWDFVSASPNSNDDNDHGTHVAGIIGAKGNNQIGIAGVNWQVSLIPVKFLNERGSDNVGNAIEAIYYSVKMGAQVINASWGGDSYSRALEEAIEYARDRGVLVVVAAGNDSLNNDTDKDYPAAYTTENIISVAATDNRDELASFSNYGRQTVHVAAPGVLITSTVPNSGYEAFSGTSMAAPHVTGIAALMWSIDPNFTYQEIKERIVKSCDVIYGLKRKIIGQGRVNAYNAAMGIFPKRDPAEDLWQDYSYQVESPHPYEDAKELKIVLSVPKAEYVRIHFNKIDTEEFDKIYLETIDGRPIETLSGQLENYTSEPVKDSVIVLRFRTDLSLAKWGFRIDKLQYVPLL